MSKKVAIFTPQKTSIFSKITLFLQKTAKNTAFLVHKTQLFGVFSSWNVFLSIFFWIFKFSLKFSSTKNILKFKLVTYCYNLF